LVLRCYQKAVVKDVLFMQDGWKNYDKMTLTKWIWITTKKEHSVGMQMILWHVAKKN